MLLGRYGLIEMARKVVGIGSVGTRCLVALLEAAPDDHLILQAKEAGPSALEPFLEPSPRANHGQRVVVGQRLMQPAPDVFLGWTGSAALGTEFYVRQLWDQKGGADIEELGAADLARSGELCGVALALAHPRSGDPATVAGYLGRSDAFDTALTRFAAAYADRTEQQHRALVAAVDAGRLPGVTTAAGED